MPKESQQDSCGYTLPFQIQTCSIGKINIPTYCDDRTRIENASASIFATHSPNWVRAS